MKEIDEMSIKIAPTSSEMVSAWLSIGFAMSMIFHTDQFSAWLGFFPYQSFIHSLGVPTLLLCLAAIQFSGAFFPKVWIRALGCGSALSVWLFCAVFIGMIGGSGSPIFYTSLVIAWSQSCALGQIIRGINRG